MTAREALAHGRPVVATRVGGLADLGAGALLVPPGDPAELRRALEQLLGDPALRRQLGAEGRRNAVTPDAAGELLAAAYVSSLA
jgi:glycosyltransferase involved in cell wall biosynthesis